jgi:NAD(P)-dependent dehydrogenase (short-subunit alcohol dehydrogenase family)
VLAITRAVTANELQYGIRVNCVSPTKVEGLWVQLVIEAAAVLHLASDDAPNDRSGASRRCRCDDGAQRGGINGPDGLVVR